MTTPLKALIQERLRAKIVRQGDDDDEIAATTPRQRFEFEFNGEHALRSGDKAQATSGASGNRDQEISYSPQAQTSYGREEKLRVGRCATQQRRAHSPIKSFHYDTDGWRRNGFEQEQSNQDDAEFNDIWREGGYDTARAADHPMRRKNYDLTEHYERYRNYNKREYARIGTRGSVTQHRSPRNAWVASHLETTTFTPYSQYHLSAPRDRSGTFHDWPSPQKRPLPREATRVSYPPHPLPQSPLDGRRRRDEFASNQHDNGGHYHRIVHHHDELQAPKLYIPPVTLPSPSEHSICRPTSHVECASEQLGRIRVYDETLSPGSRQAAKDFVAKRQRRSGQNTPRTMATQRWLQSLNGPPHREGDDSPCEIFYPIDLGVVRASSADKNENDSGRATRD